LESQGFAAFTDSNLDHCKQAVALLDLLVLRNIIRNCHTHYLLLLL
jgi:hypothetical protein